MTKEQLRGALLRAAYDAQDAGKVPMQSNQFLSTLGIGSDERDWIAVANGLDYLSDHGYVEAKRISALGRGFPVHMVTRVTGLGVDVVEGKLQDSAIVNLQVIGTNYGQAVQHGTINVTVPAFPAADLRALLQGHDRELSAVDEIEKEMRSPKPRVGSITTAIELLKAVADAPAAVATIVGWVSRPEVRHFLFTHLTH